MTSAPGSRPSQPSSGARTSTGRPARPARSATTGNPPWQRTPAADSASASTRPRGAGISDLSAALLECLRCPLTRGRLLSVDEHRLMSELPHREGIHPVYEVVDGIPHLLPAQGMAERRQR
ncbi:Trm112 family protein [Kocuria palustris]|uniref:Trm112 family protein n=1 Tax=Kocuria palustris TaxID=71999 RepID=UPI0011A2037B|nr:hypothetical protein [Kocuria palustris]